ncbi:TPA: hypothetical protein ACH3X1_007923 [Trebouxia sp. C0004]
MRPCVVALATINTENDQTSREHLECAGQLLCWLLQEGGLALASALQADLASCLVNIFLQGAEGSGAGYGWGVGL